MIAVVVFLVGIRRSVRRVPIVRSRPVFGMPSFVKPRLQRVIFARGDLVVRWLALGAARLVVWMSLSEFLWSRLMGGSSQQAVLRSDRTGNTDRSFSTVLCRSLLVQCRATLGPVQRGCVMMTVFLGCDRPTVWTRLVMVTLMVGILMVLLWCHVHRLVMS